MQSVCCQLGMFTHFMCRVFWDSQVSLNMLHVGCLPPVRYVNTILCMMFAASQICLHILCRVFASGQICLHIIYEVCLPASQVCSHRLYDGCQPPLRYFLCGMLAVQGVRSGQFCWICYIQVVGAHSGIFENIACCGVGKGPCRVSSAIHVYKV